jgi:hypothetical protein
VRNFLRPSLGHLTHLEMRYSHLNPHYNFSPWCKSYPVPTLGHCTLVYWLRLVYFSFFFIYNDPLRSSNFGPQISVLKFRSSKFGLQVSIPNEKKIADVFSKNPDIEIISKIGRILGSEQWSRYVSKHDSTLQVCPSYVLWCWTFLFNIQKYPGW